MALKKQGSEPRHLHAASNLPASTETTSSSIKTSSATLAAILTLLDAFNHRHHNQHRASHWWSTFGVFRRSLRALADSLSKKPLDSSRNRTDNATIRASWLQTHILPRAYLAFSQLAADNQHAPLGLFLLATLGQVHSLLSSISPGDVPCRNSDKLAPKPSIATSLDRPSTTDTERIDRGIAISRDTVLHTEHHAVIVPEPKKGNRDDAKIDAKGIAKDKRDGDIKPKKKKKKKAGDELSSLFGSLS